MATIATGTQNKSGIYKITNNINGKCYIGQSINLSRRVSVHKRGASKGCRAVYAAINKYGINSFDITVVFECSPDFLDDAERLIIAQYNSVAPNGYNLTLGGGSHIVVSDETRQLMSDRKIGTVRSQEAIEKQKATFSLISSTEEYRCKLREARALYTHTPEQCRKISESQKGKIITADQRIRMARAHMNGRAVLCSNGEIYMSVREAADACGVHTDSVLRVCSGKHKQAKGYSFKYIEAP